MFAGKMISLEYLPDPPLLEKLLFLLVNNRLQTL
jgi:hypothetical protein